MDRSSAGDNLHAAAICAEDLSRRRRDACTTTLCGGQHAMDETGRLEQAIFTDIQAASNTRPERSANELLNLGAVKQLGSKAVGLHCCDDRMETSIGFRTKRKVEPAWLA